MACGPARDRPYVLALDCGTTAVKGVLFDRSGRIVAARLEEYALLHPAPGHVELDVETYWQSALKAIRAVLAASKVAPQDVLSIGVTSQGETLIVLDDNGRPLRRAIVWLDNRSHAEAAALAANFDPDEVYRRTGQHEIVPTWTATRVKWLQQNERETFRKARKFLLVADYLVYRLTGRYATDRGLNPSTLYYDLTTGDWWPEMLEFLGVDAERLPALTGLGEVAGALTASAAQETGLSRETLVTTAPIDQVAAAVGAGNLETGEVTECTGAALALCATVERPVYDPQRRVGLYSHAMPGRCVLMPWAPTAGMALRWFRDTFAPGEDYTALIREAAAVGPGAEGLVMLPHLCGAFGQEPDSRAKGAFFGITLGHRRGHFVRAILESIAFLLRENMEMLESLGCAVREIRSLGGGARSELWLQIKADVCAKDILLPECEEAASLGTAMISLVGSGACHSLEEARTNMVRVRRRLPFRKEQAGLYRDLYERYRTLGRTLKGT